MFPEEMKAGDINSLFRKDDTFSRKELPTTHSLVIYIKNLRKIDALIPFFQCFLSPLLYGFRKSYNAQHALLNFVISCKKSLDSGCGAGAVMMDFSKAFDCLNHELLIANWMHMVLLDLHCSSSIAIFMTVSRWLKLMVLLVHGQEPSLEYRKAQSWDPFYSTYT